MTGKAYIADAVKRDMARIETLLLSLQGSVWKNYYRTPEHTEILKIARSYRERD